MLDWEALSLVYVLCQEAEEDPGENRHSEEVMLLVRLYFCIGITVHQ